MVAPSAADVATGAPVSALSASGTGVAAWPRRWRVVLLLGMISSFALCEVGGHAPAGAGRPWRAHRLQRGQLDERSLRPGSQGLAPTTLRNGESRSRVVPPGEVWVSTPANGRRDHLGVRRPGRPPA